jgi:hypothetical protein
MGADTQCIKKRMRVHIYINRGSLNRGDDLLNNKG